VPSFTKLLTHPEIFNPSPSVASVPSTALFIIDQETKLSKARYVNGIYIPLTTDDDEDDPTSLSQSSLAQKVLSLVTSPLKLFTSTVLWHWEDNAAPSNNRKQVTTLQTRNIALTVLLHTTPLEAMRSKLAVKEFGSALELAKRFELPVDEIYQHKWRDLFIPGEEETEITEEVIRDVLARVEDRKWVLEECVGRVPGTAGGARLLLQYGVKMTEGVGLSDVEGEIEKVLRQFDSDAESPVREDSPTKDGVTVLDVCLYRTKFLRFLDRLETHEAIYAGTDYSPYGGYAVHLEWFRTVSLISLAFEFAQDANFHALEVLFTRHPEVLRYWFGILANVPEVVDVLQYKHLLPKLDTRTGREMEWPVVPWRKKDWTSTPSVREFVGIVEDSDDTNPLQEGVFKSDYPASKEDVCQFYERRAREIEEASGVVDFAVDLVR
ncbi:hypothetical protein HK097_006339, partial [Rhizophlyctis rosea]